MDIDRERKRVLHCYIFLATRKFAGNYAGDKK